MNGYEIEYHTGIGSAFANKYVVKLSDMLVRSKRQSKQPEKCYDILSTSLFTRLM